MVRRSSAAQAAALVDLGHRSLTGTVFHIAPLVAVEATMPDAHGFGGIPLTALVLAFIGIRLFSRHLTINGLGTLRQRWIAFSIGALGISALWGVVNAAVQIRQPGSMSSVVMGVVVSGISVGGVTAFAPNRVVQALALSGLTLPTIACGVVGGVPTAIMALYGVFFVYMTILGTRASRDYWQAVVSARLLEEHAVAQAAAAAAANAMNEQLRAEIAHRAALEIELRHAQKLEAVGRLAAGIAHEINTPLQYLADSCQFLRDGIADLEAGSAEYAKLLSSIASGETTPEVAATHAARLRGAHDLDFLREELPRATTRLSEGLQRIGKIIGATQEFAGSRAKGKRPTDINAVLENALVMCRHETTPVADVSVELAELPLAECDRGELGQAFLNLIVNAAYAVGGATRGTGQRGHIKIKTSLPVANRIRVEISDTGGGIPLEIVDKIFEPFFTTKPVGEGAGQGLAVARAIVVGKHGGTLAVSSVPQIGSTFAITIPV